MFGKTTESGMKKAVMSHCILVDSFAPDIVLL